MHGTILAFIYFVLRLVNNTARVASHTAGVFWIGKIKSRYPMAFWLSAAGTVENHFLCTDNEREDVGGDRQLRCVGGGIALRLYAVSRRQPDCGNGPPLVRPGCATSLLVPESWEELDEAELVWLAPVGSCRRACFIAGSHLHRRRRRLPFSHISNAQMVASPTFLSLPYRTATAAPMKLCASLGSWELMCTHFPGLHVEKAKISAFVQFCKAELLGEFPAPGCAPWDNTAINDTGSATAPGE